MRIGALAVMIVVFAWPAIACGGRGGLFRQYEYEEDMYLALDGSATLYVNSSIPALNALRGATFDARPNARVDLDLVRAYFTTPVTRVIRVSSTRRRNRRFVHVRLESDDVRRLSEAGPFSWSSYQFSKQGDLVAYRQAVGGAAGGGAEPVRWDGDELVAFRVHLPSRIRYHNSPTGEERGSIVAWEQPLAARLGGAPLAIEVRMEPDSILGRTLLLFGGTLLAVAAMFAAVIWWIISRGRKLEAGG